MQIKSAPTGGMDEEAGQVCAAAAAMTSSTGDNCRSLTLVLPAERDMIVVRPCAILLTGVCTM
jgi:hypothetical protein